MAGVNARGKRPLRPEPRADVEADECLAVSDDGCICSAASGHGGNHTAHGFGATVLHVWRRT